MSSIRFENVTKKYGKVLALNNVSFECNEGEFFTLLGPSGAGKTTTLVAAAGLKKIDDGKIFFNGEDVGDIPPQDRDVAMAFENYALYSHLNVYDNIAFPLRSPKRDKKLTPEEEKAEVVRIATRLGIGEFLQKMPKHLSGGQKQRVSLARAMVRRPQVFLLDEPIAHLDAKLRALARSDLKKIASEVGTTIMYVTHNYREALALSDRILVMREGRVEQIGTPKEIYNEPASDFVANLVGDPPVNLLDGVFDESAGTFTANGFHFALSDEMQKRAKEVTWVSEGKQMLRMAIRAEHVSVTEQQGNQASARLPVFVMERKDEDYIIKFRLGSNGLLISNMGKAASSFKEGQEVWVNFDLNYAHLFTKTFELA